LIRRYSSSLARFSGDEITTAVHCRPNEVRPTSISRTLGLAAASLRKYAIDSS
jgi:hypothetical protein